MLQLHDRTRRRIGVTAFIVVGLLPTLAVVACGLWRHSPACARREAERIGNILGVTAAVGEVEYVRPGVLRYTGVEFSDPETGRVFFCCPRMEVSAQSGENAPGAAASVVLRFTQPKIDVARFEPIKQLADRLLGRRMDGLEGGVELLADEMQVAGIPDLPKLSHPWVQLQGTRDKTQALIVFQLSDRPVENPAGVRITRHRAEGVARQEMEFTTGSAPLPCSLLSLGFRELEVLGPSAEFQGSLACRHDSDGCYGHFAGRLSAFELDRLMSGRFPHLLSGRATCVINRAEFGRGRLENATGRLVAESGVIGRSLIDACAKYMAIEAGQAHLPAARVHYTPLDFGFAIAGSQLTLQGLCPDAPPGTLLINEYGAILIQPDSRPRTVASLLVALDPFGGAYVPATPAAGRVLAYLPLESSPEPRSAAQPSTDPAR